MSGGKRKRSLAELGTIAAVLIALHGIALVAIHVGAVPTLGRVTIVGFVLLAGRLTSALLEPIGIPHISAYILAGAIAGPHVLHLVDHDSMESLGSVNSLALALIALAGGAELELAMVRRLAKSLAVSNLIQTLSVLATTAGAFMLARPFIPFARDLPLPALAGAALLWAVIAVSRSPSAVLAVLSQTRAHGPVASFTLGFIMTSDIVVILVLAAAMTLARTLLEPGAQLSLEAFAVLGHETLGSISIGTTLGLLLIGYVRVVGRQLLLVFVLLGFGFSEALRYLHFEPILTFMVAGFVVRNLSKSGEVLLHEIEKLAGMVFVLFFSMSGAHLDLPLVSKLWPVAVGLGAVRLATTWVAARLSSNLTNDDPAVKRWGWAGLISQAGLSLGIAAIIERSFPQLGTDFRSLVVATIALHEVVGPLLFKLALDRNGETRA